MPPTNIHVETCSLCDGPLSLVLALAPTPPANELLSEPVPNRELYDLNLMMCKSCQHLQLDTEISMFRLFKNDYVFTSNTSSSNLAYFSSYAKSMMKRFKPEFVVDIGSNDGTFLHFFQSNNVKVLGVDPADNIVQIAKNNSVPTECSFFNDMKALDIVAHHSKADLITCNNMFAHNRNLNEVVLGVKQLLAPKGTFVFEVSYALSLLQHNLFDLIYHEHFHHWHVSPAIAYLRKFGLEIYDAELIPQTHGGSIRVYAQHSDQFTGKTERLQQILQNEDWTFSDSLKTFQNQVPDLKTNLMSKLRELKQNSKDIAAYGYPAKACTMSYYFELDKYITQVYDDNPLKIGKYTHHGIKIEPTAFMYKHKPDYLIILSWNYQEEILKKHKLFKRTGGKFIVPLPELRYI